MYCSRQAPLSMGILQARILEWVAMPSSRGSSSPRDQTWSSLKPKKQRGQRLSTISSDLIQAQVKTTHSSILTWRIPWKGEPSRLQSIQSMGSQRVGHDWATNSSTVTFQVKNLTTWTCVLWMTSQWHSLGHWMGDFITVPLKRIRKNVTSCGLSPSLSFAPSYTF